jgi:hypothetical protein
MKKSKIEISATILDSIAKSGAISDKEKLNFLRYVGYMSYEEQQELVATL